MRADPAVLITPVVLGMLLLLAVLTSVLPPAVLVVVAVGICALMAFVTHGHEGAR